MTFVLYDHVARIIVGDGQSWRVATGCVVAARAGGARILTTRHKLFDGTFTIAQIEVRVRDEVRTTFKIVWQSIDRDLVLLDCGDFGTTAPPLGTLPSGSRPALYRSIGFPKAGRQEDRTRRPIELSGRLYLGDPGSDVVQLGVDYPPADVEDWAGASGSPVFVDGALVAVIREVPYPFAGRRIDALALERVLRMEPELRSLLHEPEASAPNPANEIADRTRALIGRISSVHGRAEELAALDRYIADNSGLPCLVCAPGGTGKSALIAHWVESRSPNANVTIIRHFFSRTERLTSSSEAYAHLLSQLGGMTEPAPRKRDETELRAELYAQLKGWHTREPEHRLVVVIDGLDEADRFPPLPDPLPIDVAVIASLRAGIDEVPAGYEDWLVRCRRLQLSGLGYDELAAWLASSPVLAKLADNSQFVTELLDRTGGFPLYLQFLLEDLELAVQRGAPATELASRPKGFSRYIQQQLAVIARDEAMRSKELQRLFAVVAVAVEPLDERDIEALTRLNVIELQNLPPAVTRWFTRRMVGGTIEYAFTHPLLAREFRQALGRLASDVEADLLVYCLRWQEHRSEFALRSLGAQLRASGRVDELVALARDEAYADAQHARTDGDRAHLRMLRHAIDACIADQRWDAVCELLLRHGLAVDHLVLASSPFALQAAGKLEQAIAVADLCAPLERVIWYLALAGRCFRDSDRASARALLDKIAAVRPEPAGGWQAEAIGAVLLSVVDDAPDDFLTVAQRWLGNEVGVTSGLVEVLVARGNDKGALQLSMGTGKTRHREARLSIALRDVKREGAAALPRAEVLYDVTEPARQVEALCDLGAALLERGDEAGRELFAEAHAYLEDSHDEDYALRYLAVAEWRAGMTDEATRTLTLVGEPIQRGYACIGIARAELDAGRSPGRWLLDAEQALEGLDYASARAELSVLYERVGNADAAARVQGQIRDRGGPRSKENRAELAEKRVDAGLFDRALEMLPELGNYRTGVYEYILRALIERGRLDDVKRLEVSSWRANTGFALARAGHVTFACEVIAEVMVRFAKVSRQAPVEAQSSLATIAAVVARRGDVDRARELMSRANAPGMTRALDLPAVIRSGDRATAVAILRDCTVEQCEIFMDDIAGLLGDTPDHVGGGTWFATNLAVARTLRASLDRQLECARRFAAWIPGTLDAEGWQVRRAVAALVEAHVASGAIAELYPLFDARPELIVPAFEALGRCMDGPCDEPITRCEGYGERALIALAGFAIGRLERGDTDTARRVIYRLALVVLHALGRDTDTWSAAVDLHVASAALGLKDSSRYEAVALRLVAYNDEDKVFARMFQRFLQLRDDRRAREAWNQIRDPFSRGHALFALRHRPSVVVAAAPYVEVVCGEITTRREGWVPGLVELLVEVAAVAAVSRLLPMGGESSVTACLMSAVVARAWPVHAAAIGEVIASFCARTTESAVRRRAATAL